MRRLLGGLLFLLLLGDGQLHAADVKPLSASQASAVIREYLACDDLAKKHALLDKVGATKADPQLLIRALVPSQYPDQHPGQQLDVDLPMPASVSPTPAKYSLQVPTGYQPTHLWPLIIGLHGGGEGEGSGAQELSVLADLGPMLVACPTSVNLTVQQYWRDPRNETMLACMVQSLSQRFPIDPNRIYLTGYSMGGIGTYYLAPRLSERFAAASPGGGAWCGVYWPELINTPMYILHGKGDMRGANFTNFTYAQHAVECLTEAHCPFELRAVDSGHADIPQGEFAVMAKWLLKFTRDPYPKHLVHASPCAKDFSVPLQGSPANRWLVIDQTGADQLPMECVTFGGDTREKQPVPMGVLDATWTAANILEVKATNVVRFQVLLNAKLVNMAKPVTITVNGQVAFHGIVASSLSFALQYVDAHRDPGMIFVASVPITVDAHPASAPAKP